MSFGSIDHIFDVVFRLMGPLSPMGVLSIISVFTATLSLFVFRWTSNQDSIRRVKDRIGAHILEVRLFPDQLGVVVRAYMSLIGSILLYLRHALRPMLVLGFPLMLLFSQFDDCLDYSPVEAGHDFLVRTTFGANSSFADSALQLPSGLTLSAPPVRILAEREVDWRLKGEKPGSYEINVSTQEGGFSKRIVIGGGLSRLVAARKQGGAWQRIVNPGEPPLPPGGPVEQIFVQYPQRVFSFRTWQTNWLAPFIVGTVAAGFFLKNLFKIAL